MKYSSFRPWFYAHGIYNFVWGTVTIVFPKWYFKAIGLPQINYLPIWQVVGMFVLVYAPAYFWVGKDPEKHYHLAIIAFLGTIFGISGFFFSAITGNLDFKFGWTIISNDLVWIPMFVMFFGKIYKDHGMQVFFTP